MPFSNLPSLAAVKTTLDAIQQVHGGYQAVDLLGQAMSQVSEPDGFDKEAKQAEEIGGMKYEGPDGATRAILKTAETAAETSGERQDVLVDIIALVLVKLGSMQGAKVMVGMLALVGVHPALGAILVKVLLVMLQSESGRAWVTQSWPTIEKHVTPLWKLPAVQPHLRRVASELGETGSQWVQSAMSLPGRVASSAMERGDALLDDLTSILRRDSSEPTETRGRGSAGDSAAE